LAPPTIALASADTRRTQQLQKRAHTHTYKCTHMQTHTHTHGTHTHSSPVDTNDARIFIKGGGNKQSWCGSCSCSPNALLGWVCAMTCFSSSLANIIYIASSF
jgi:hypothetical protein